MPPWTLLPPPPVAPPTAVELAVSGLALALAGLAESGRYAHAPGTATVLAGAAPALGGALRDELREVWTSLRWSVGR